MGTVPELTWKMLCAASERRAQFQIEMPRILATCTQGEKSGPVEIVSFPPGGRPSTDKGRVVIMRAGHPKRYVVTVESLDVDAATAEHLQRCVNWLQAWKRGGYLARLRTNKA